MVRATPETHRMADRPLRLEGALALLGLAIIAGGCFLVLRPFAGAMLWAVVFVAATWRPYQWLAQRVGRGRAAMLVTLGTALLTLVPMVFLTVRGAAELGALRDVAEVVREHGLPEAPAWLAGVPLVGESLSDWWGGMRSDLGGLVALLRPYLDDAASLAFSVVLGFANGLLELILALVVAYFLFRDGETLAAVVAESIGRLTPQAGHFMMVAGGTVRSVVLGIVGTALCQGVLAGIGLAIAGVPGPVLLGFLTMLGSPFPVLPVLPWLGGTLWLLYEGDQGWAIFMAIWGLAAVSSADNFVRPWLISLGSPLPMLLILLGVLGGVIAFGFLGLFLGPTVLALGHALVLEWVRGTRAEAMLNGNDDTAIS
jgi:predicted PurR-regulated permease PerM